MHYHECTTTKILEYARAHGRKLKEYNDTTCGYNYLAAVETRKIKNHNIIVQLSLDGTQLYPDNDSDCWIFVYIIHNLALNLCYKKQLVIPAGFIPGPKKIKDSNSFLYLVLYHISALQNEGLQIWDALTQSHLSCLIPYVFMIADSPAMAMVSGMVDHSGKYGYHLYCGLFSHHQERDKHYYPTILKPNAYKVVRYDHSDITFSNLKQY
jgi:tnp2 family transposase